jgi:hypothetical protein
MFMKTDRKTKEIMNLENFSNGLKAVTLKNSSLKIGSFSLKVKQIKSDGFSNFSGIDLLDFKLQFQTTINGQKIIFYIQLYKNVTSSGNEHFRLASYVKSKTKKGLSRKGMIFTINLSKQKYNEEVALVSKLTFTQQPDGHKEIAKSHRRLKQYLLAEILNNIGIDITDNNDVVFGIYDLNSSQFLNTSAEKFIHDFLVVTILKGHFMANKGYEIEIFPSFKKIGVEFESMESDKNIRTDLPDILKDQRAKRAIPLSLRFKVLHRDRSTCLACGKTPKDGVKLHIDHITPHSKGGLTIFKNLRTLCNECNIGRSNQIVD